MSLNSVNVLCNKVLVTFGPPATFGELPPILRSGRRLDDFLPDDDQWREAVSNYPSLFRCNFCDSPVVYFADSNIQGTC
jgi:hypothetical protein